jgi:hypothetical protein
MPRTAVHIYVEHYLEELNDFHYPNDNPDLHTVPPHPVDHLHDICREKRGVRRPR